MQSMSSALRTLPIRSVLFNQTRAAINRTSRTPLFRKTLVPRRTMASQEIVFTKDAPAPVGPYSQAVKTPTAIYCSGQIHIDPATSKLVADATITEKTQLCLKNLDAVLKAAGTTMANVVKVTIFLSSMDHFPEMNKEYEKWMAHKPSRSCVAAKTLPLNADVEIEAIALPGSQ